MSPLVRVAILLLLILIPAAAAVSQDGAVRPSGDPIDYGRPNLRTFTDRDGLPQNAISALVFDHQGYLWAGTKDGAVRYDGRTWTVVTMPTELRTNWIQAMVATSDGALWFGTNNGLARLAAGQWTTYDKAAGLPSNEINCLYETRSGSGLPVVWVGASGGLARFENGVWTKETPIARLPDAAVSTIYEVRAPGARRALWIGTYEEGIARLQDGAWTAFDRSSGYPNRGATCFVESSALDGRTALYSGTFGQGVMRFDGTTWSLVEGQPVGGLIVYAMRETRAPDGSLTFWLATNGGIDRFERGRWLRIDARSGLPDTAIWSLVPVESPTGTRGIWAGTAGLGVVHLQFGGWTMLDTMRGPRGNLVYSVLTTRAEDGSPVVWIGTISDGLARFNRGVWTYFDQSNGLTEKTVWCMREAADEDGRNAIWLGTNMGGLFRFKDGSWSQYGPDEGVPGVGVNALFPTVAPDGSPALWVGTINGLARFEHGKGTTDLPGLTLRDKRVRCLVETKGAGGGKVLWVGTEGGLVRYESGVSTLYDEHSGILANSVTCLYEWTSPAGRRTLWVGSRAGVALMDLDAPTPTWTSLSTSSTPALPNNTIYRVEGDAQGRVYCFTNKGVARLTSREPTDDDPARFAVYTYTTLDGLPSNECNTGASTVDADGRIWAGTIGGAAVFDPAREISDASSKPLVIGYASLPELGRGLVAGESLPHGDNHVYFDFALLSFFREGDTRYRSQLVGLEEAPSDWTAQPFRDYISLPPGDYSFRVWARDAVGTVSGPVEVPFTILPAPWLTWWAFTLYGLVAAYAIFVAFRLRVRALHRRNEQLEAGIVERTAQIARSVDELRASERRALEANRAKSVFLANMSHELRTPLNAILGFVQLMERDRALNRTHQESLGIISRSGEHLLGLINDVLSIAKIEAGKESLVDQTFDLHELVRSVCEMIRVRAEAKDLTVELALDPDVPVVMSGDQGKLRQVLVNLLGNAVKFTESGGVVLRVSWKADPAAESAPSRGRATFEVSDTGCGMSPEEVANLFEPFTQMESGQKTSEGTGLGLVISRDFVRLMGGDMRVASEKGVGSTFSFDVVLRVASHVDRRASARRDPVAVAPDSPAWRILVVDDVEENRVLLTRLLESLGIDTRTGANGREAVDLWQAWHPHLIWMDMRMPVMDGLEATREIRQREGAGDEGSGERCRILALTASAFEHDRDRFLSAGCDDFVPKPFQTATIVSKMAQHLGMRFVYDAGEPVAPEPVGAEVTPDRLRDVPAPLLASLRTALLGGDVESVLDVAARLRDRDPRLADDLVADVRAYRFDDLLEALDVNESG